MTAGQFRPVQGDSVTVPAGQAAGGHWPAGGLGNALRCFPPNSTVQSVHLQYSAVFSSVCNVMLYVQCTDLSV